MSGESRQQLVHTASSDLSFQFEQQQGTLVVQFRVVEEAPAENWPGFRSQGMLPIQYFVPSAHAERVLDVPRCNVLRDRFREPAILGCRIDRRPPRVREFMGNVLAESFSGMASPPTMTTYPLRALCTSTTRAGRPGMRPNHASRNFTAAAPRLRKTRAASGEPSDEYSSNPPLHFRFNPRMATKAKSGSPVSHRIKR